MRKSNPHDFHFFVPAPNVRHRRTVPTLIRGRYPVSCTAFAPPMRVTYGIIAGFLKEPIADSLIDQTQPVEYGLSYTDSTGS